MQLFLRNVRLVSQSVTKCGVESTSSHFLESRKFGRERMRRSKNAWSYTSNYPIHLHGVALSWSTKTTLHFTFTFTC